MLLAGDIGGTKTHLAIYSSPRELRTPVVDKTFPSARYSSLEVMVKEFLMQVDANIDRACFGVAGPIVQGKAKITNLPWLMDEVELQRNLGIEKVRLLNDLAAMAYGVPLLSEEETYILNKGVVNPQGPIAVVAPGTGLGEAYLVHNGSHYVAYGSEGGHADFAPLDEKEIGLLRFMLERTSHVSYEHVCSGIGLPNIYAYLESTGIYEVPKWLSEQLAQETMQTPTIIKGAKESSMPICVEAVRMFASILGAEAGNVALKVLATGGVYIGGGLPPRILPYLSDGSFMKTFVAKGRMGKMLADYPVSVIQYPNTALVGAASFGFTL
ncbi:glucokinase [Ktedonospora formicarum]|uniref:Glucokinase n=1 Tax=Ktedonospora formicarum TaxID=2778364 RepID=A0A8J3I063_9CHLR|nr:glucokinase [Ktedonospora formicarum]GHO46386.1 glucokinase [Ktedonospora formicarum]